MLMNVFIEWHNLLRGDRIFWIANISLLGTILGSYLGVITYRTSHKILKQNALYDPNNVIHSHSEVKKSTDPTSHQNRLNQYFYHYWSTIKNVKWLSHCPHCFSHIAPQYNIPILGWIYLKGRCIKCKSSISLRYLFIELQTLTIFFLVAYHTSYSLASCLFLLFIFFSIALFWTDLEHFLLPNILTLSMLFIGLFVNLGAQFVDFENALLGAFIGYCSFWLINWLYKTWRGYDGLGQGDIKYLSAIGAWLGYTALPYIVFVASFLGLTAVLIFELIKLICPKSFKLRFPRLNSAQALPINKKSHLYSNLEIHSDNRLNHRLPFGVFLSISSSLYFYWVYFCLNA